MNDKRLAEKVLSELKQIKLNGQLLNFDNEYQCFVAALLSAQCTDKMVNSVTPSFFARWGDFYSLSKANVDDIKKQIGSINYCNNKARFLSLASKKVVDTYGGHLPHDLDNLMTLDGVGRKVAQVIMSNIFRDQNAMPVDTHIFRVVNKIFGKNFKTPKQTEIFLRQNFESNDFEFLHKKLVLFGRNVCKSRNKLCDSCQLVEFCIEYNGKKE